jgi:deoxyadenosine/deoxycytidine kinase
MKKFITIAGNMGVGKTTLAKKLAGHYDWRAMLEPVDNNPYIEKFYGDMARWAFHSQLFFLTKAIEQHSEIVNGELSSVLDRSVYEHANIFAQNCYDSGYITDDDWEIYRSLYSSFIDTVAPPDLMIFLKASDAKIVERIERRSRKYEIDIDREYFLGLNRLYNQWGEDYDLSDKLILNYDELDLRDNIVDWNKFLEDFAKFI